MHILPPPSWIGFFSGKGDAKSKGSEEGTECCDTSVVVESKVSVAGVKLVKRILRNTSETRLGVRHRDMH